MFYLSQVEHIVKCHMLHTISIEPLPCRARYVPQVLFCHGVPYRNTLIKNYDPHCIGSPLEDRDQNHFFMHVFLLLSRPSEHPKYYYFCCQATDSIIRVFFQHLAQRYQAFTVSLYIVITLSIISIHWLIILRLHNLLYNPIMSYLKQYRKVFNVRQGEDYMDQLNKRIKL